MRSISMWNRTFHDSSLTPPSPLSNRGGEHNVTQSNARKVSKEVHLNLDTDRNSRESKGSWSSSGWMEPQSMEPQSGGSTLV